ncbi:MAG TPA: hypothetical protein P5265_04225 [Bacteroidia bacterium]|nr:hypothetical protein [Bacteroidia bacterium]
MEVIDIEKSIRESNSEFLKKLPKFIIRIISKIIYEKRMNEYLAITDGLEGVDFHNKIIELMDIKIHAEGLHNLPERPHCFFFANHPFGVLDGLVLTKTVLDKYHDFRAIGNEAFKYVPNLRKYVMMVNVYGSTSRKYVEELEKIYESDMPITHFPAGLVSRFINWKVQDIEWKKSFISKAVSCKRDLVPFYFEGHNSWLFYFVSTFRRMIGIKLTLELALLPHEFFNKKGRTVHVIIGKPISWQVFDNRFSHHEWAQKVREHLYKMGKSGNPDLEFTF